MPRNQNAGNLALRNRNRVTNKTRLKVIKGNIDADPIVLDEDEERARVVSTAGVDAEDANEHHLQAVLSAASHRATTHAQRAARGASEKVEKKNEPTTLIPVPDAAGVVENYVELYPINRWVTPASYVKFSDVVEECITNAIADGFTYVMDERDEEWLEKNNQDARGEGTSSQPSNASGTTTRSGGLHRSAKSKGKEPETHQAVQMSEDNFELVMGLFEKITHDNTPFLHLDHHQAADSLPFSDYQEVFSNELPHSYFATHLRPPNIPPPATLVRMARAVYPHWRARKQEREGHRIIPSLNFDEGDTKNESYICFRRREIKAVRKTRAAQVSSSEKLIRLKNELNTAFDLSRMVLTRESLKREAAAQQRLVWERRMVVADFKRMNPLFGTREDEELLVDRERVLKRPRPSDASSTHPPKWQKLRPSTEVSSSPAPVEPLVRPRERTNKILNAIEENIKRQKERDTHWDDQIDSPYQPMPVPYGERMFKDLSKPQDNHIIPPAERQEPVRVLFRSRIGRGGFRFVDRRYTTSHAREINDQMLKGFYRQHKDSENVDELTDQLAHISERHRYDEPCSLESSVDEEDRIVIDDFTTKYLRYNMSLLNDTDQAQLLDMRHRHDGVTVSPLMHQLLRDGASAQQRQVVTSPLQATHGSVNAARVNGVVPTTAGVPVSVQTPVRQPSQPAASQPIRVPSNGPQRPPSAASPTNAAASSSPIHRPASAAMPNANVASTQNGVNGTFVNGGQPITLSLPNGVQPTPPSVKSPSEPLSINQVPVTTPPRPTSQNQVPNAHQQQQQSQQQLANGLAGLGNYPGMNYSLPAQQLRQSRGIFDGSVKQQMLQHQTMLQQQLAQQRLNLSTYPHVTGANLSNMPPSVNINLKLPANRQQTWQRAQQHQSQQSQQQALEMMQAAQMQLANINGAAQIASLNGHVSPSRPSQSPSNMMLGQLPDAKSPTLQHLQHAHSPHLGSPTPAHLSPPRNMQTPIPSSSPLPQHQHIANGANHGQAY